MCGINRSSIYLLLAIMINLCCLTYELYVSIRSRENTGVDRKRETIFHLFCVGFPVVLGSIGYALDTNDPYVGNAVLNVARHGFKCSMRFASMPLEWAFVWARTWLRCSIYMLLCTSHLFDLSLSFFSRLFVEWYLDLRVFFWYMVGNSLSAKDKYAEFKGQHLPQPIKATAA
jgi:hypothetical protein